MPPLPSIIGDAEVAVLGQVIQTGGKNAMRVLLNSETPVGGLQFDLSVNSSPLSENTPIYGGQAFAQDWSVRSSPKCITRQ